VKTAFKENDGERDHGEKRSGNPEGFGCHKTQKRPDKDPDGH